GTLDLVDTQLTQTVITSKNRIVIYRYRTDYGTFIVPFEFKTFDYGRADRDFGEGPGVVPIEGGILVEWRVPTARVEVTGLYDLKGNPVLLPEYITLKVQVLIGGKWVEFSTDQVRWTPTLKNLRDVLVNICGKKLGRAVDTLKDLMDCYRSMQRSDFVEAVRRLYSPATLSFAIGMLQLTDGKAEVKVGEGLRAKLVAEYFYPESGATTSAVVGVYPIVAKAPGSVRTDLTVALLPVAIRLYQYDGNILPNGKFLTITSSLTNLRFRIEGGGVLFDKIGLEAVVKNPWDNSIMLALPPYDVPPLMVGGEKVHVMSFFNASGYLPLSPLYGTVCIDSKRVEYYNVTDIVEVLERGASVQICGLEDRVNLRDFFGKYTEISSSQNYKIEAYLGGIRVALALLQSGKYAVGPLGWLIETDDNLRAALEGEYNVLQKQLEDVKAVYNVEIRRGAGRLYSVQHLVHMAVALVTLNVLPRDLCGSTLPGGVLKLKVEYEGGTYVFESSLQRNQYEVAMPLALPVDENGIVAGDGYLLVTASLSYYGYDINAVNASTLKPLKVRIPVKLLPQLKSTITFAVSPLLFSVWSVTPEGYTKDRLSGFVVSVYSVKTRPASGEMSRSISNLTRYDNPISDKYGYAYVEGVPINETFRVIVRTIVPEADSRYPYTLAQILRRNSYGAYHV
ncbi:MAG: hypothetical protein ACP5J3_13705, partial [Pyrobaculum sp.]